MSKQIKRPIPAKALITGIRAIGYSFSTAVADIIDNSITADAKKIFVESDPLADEPYFCILDDGKGMDDDGLDNALLLGSDRTDKRDSEKELGRFGLGLKSASLSQCRRVTVATKQRKTQRIVAMCLDLDVIERDDEYKLAILNSDEINSLPCIKQLEAFKSGTLVIWNDFDRIEKKGFEKNFRQLVADAKKHIELVFHRFYNALEIYFDGLRIERRDPFLLSAHGRQPGKTNVVLYNGKKIEIVAHTLPYANSLTSEERKLLGNPKSIYDDQGFYIYRNKRLISWGGWMRMNPKSELNKLARVQIDFPSTLDSVWTLDVKKSSAKIPDSLKDVIFSSIAEATIKSKKATTFPGVKERRGDVPLWERIEARDGTVRYQINRNNPAIIQLQENLGKNESNLLDIVLSQLESFIPKMRIYNDLADSKDIQNNPSDIELETVVDQVKLILSLANESAIGELFENLFLAEQYQKFYDQKEMIKKKVFQ